MRLASSILILLFRHASVMKSIASKSFAAIAKSEVAGSSTTLQEFGNLATLGCFAFDLALRCPLRTRATKAAEVSGQRRSRPPVLHPEAIVPVSLEIGPAVSQRGAWCFHSRLCILQQHPLLGLHKRAAHSRTHRVLHACVCLQLCSRRIDWLRRKQCWLSTSIQRTVVFQGHN